MGMGTMKLRNAGLLLLLLLLVACVPATPTASTGRGFAYIWYISTTGDDSNTCDATDLPCRTLVGVTSKARAINTRLAEEHPDLLSVDHTIHMAAGTYNQPNPGAIINFNVTIIGAGQESTIIDAGGMYRGISIGGTRFANLRDFTIRNVDVNSRLGCIRLHEVEDAEIRNVTVTGCVGNGITHITGLLTLISVTVTENIEETISNDGYGVSSSGELVVVGGEFSRNEGWGISSLGSLQMNTVRVHENETGGITIGGTAYLTNVTVQDHGRTGVGIWGNATIDGSDILSNREGIVVESGGTLRLVNNSSVRANFWNGVRINGGNATIVDSDILSNRDGILVQDSGTLRLENNSTVSLNSTLGVSVKAGSVATLIDSIVAGNSGSGVFVEGTASLTNVTVRGNGGLTIPGDAGVQIEGGEATIDGSDILSNDFGIVVKDSGTLRLINNSTVSTNPRTGVHVEENSSALVDGSVVSDNGSVYADTSLVGGIRGFPNSVLTVRNSEITANHNGGIWVDPSGTLFLIESSVTENFGGLPAIVNWGTAAIERSLIAYNRFTRFPQFGEVAVLNAGTLAMTNTTVSHNVGNGITGGEDGLVTIAYSTIAENSGTGLLASGGHDTFSGVANVIVASNGISDCYPRVGGSRSTFLPISGNNIDTDGTCGFPQTFLPTALNLLPLADNTGPTLTHALGLDPRSPAIDAALAGTFIGCPGTDQRNVLRAPTASLCDVGAYEVGPTATSLIIPTRPPGSQPWCNIFESMDITVVWHDRAPGSNMQTFYLKFPEGVGVPGQEPGWDSEKFDIDGGPSEWSFHVTLGELEAVCEYKGYKGRLICENVPMLPGYPNSLRPLSLLLEGCSDPVYNTMADIPGEEIPVGGGATGCIYQGPNDNQASCYDPCPVDPAQYPAC